MREIFDKIEPWLRQIIREEVGRAIEQLEPVQVNQFEAVPSRLLSVAEAANFLGVSKSIVRLWLRRDEIPSFRIGRRVLFSMEKHIEPFLKEREMDINGRIGS